LEETQHITFQWIGSEVVDISPLLFTFPGITLCPQKTTTSTKETIGLAISPTPDFQQPCIFWFGIIISPKPTIQ